MIAIKNPYGDLSKGQWLKGNLHTHTTRSDGSRPIEEVIADYAGRKYDFLMISDHDIFTSTEYLTKFPTRDMVLIPGNEVSANGPHMLHVNAGRLIAPHSSRQQIIDEAKNDPQSFIIVNHPNWQTWFNHATIEQMMGWTGYAGLEIYNGVIGRLDGSPYATNKWDILLSHGRRLWGYANDDSHLPDVDIGLGWNMVYAKDKTLPDIVNALRNGRFYASTGVVIRNFIVNGNRIRIETENAERIVALHNVGSRFAQADANELEVEVPEKATYVRFECWGKGEKFAWSQPFYISAS